MKRYHYATVDRETFLHASKVQLPGPDAYLAKDEQTEALNSILENGYRIVRLDSESDLAVFEKELPSDLRLARLKGEHDEQEANPPTGAEGICRRATLGPTGPA